MVKVPERWYISQSSLQILGVVLLLISAFYLWACAFAKKRHLTIKASGWFCLPGASRYCRWRFPA
jgi:uncharacterized membrane protein YbhN (UPF0104 family)